MVSSDGVRAASANLIYLVVSSLTISGDHSACPLEIGTKVVHTRAAVISPKLVKSCPALALEKGQFEFSRIPG